MMAWQFFKNIFKMGKTAFYLLFSLAFFKGNSKIRKMAFFLAFFYFFPHISLGQGEIEKKIEDTKKSLESSRERQREIVQQIDKVRTHERDLLNELHTTEQEVFQNSQELRALEERLFETQKSLIMVQGDIDALRHSLETYRDILSRRLISIYKRRRVGYASFFMRSDNLMDFLKRLKLVRKIVRQDTDAFKGVRSQYALVVEKEKALREQKAELKAYNDRLDNKKKELAQLEEHRRFLLDEVGQRRERLEDEFRQIENSSAKIAGIIDELEKNRDKNKPVNKAPTGEQLQRQEAEKRAKRVAFKMSWPIGSADDILEAYGKQKTGANTSFENKGIDIKARAGSPVKAAGPGKVMYRGELKGYGQILIIDHDWGLNTLYAHLDDILVRVNQEVTGNQEVATVGDPPISEIPSLHFEIRIDGEPQNPMNWLK